MSVGNISREKGSRKMNIIIIGAGSIGKRHIKNLISIGQENITAVDKNIRQLEECNKLFPQIKTLSINEELPFHKYDVVFICTPPDSHLKLLDKAINAGCHCFMEKPFALTTEGIETLLKKAENKKLKIMTGFNMRYLPLIIELREKITLGSVGKVLSCRISLSSYMPNWHPQEDYRKSFMAFHKTGGGALFDFVHGLDLAQWFLGPIEKIFCLKQTSLLQMETDDMAALIAKTKTGTIMMFYFDFVDRVHRKSIDIIGTEGTITWDLSTEETLQHYSVKTNERTKINKKTDYNSCYVLEVEDFFKALESDMSVESNGYNGLSTMKVLDAARKSSQSNKFEKV